MSRQQDPPSILECKPGELHGPSFMFYFVTLRQALRTFNYHHL